MASHRVGAGWQKPGKIESAKQGGRLSSATGSARACTSARDRTQPGANEGVRGPRQPGGPFSAGKDARKAWQPAPKIVVLLACH
jgi:hypothetical protein